MVGISGAINLIEENEKRAREIQASLLIPSLALHVREVLRQELIQLEEDLASLRAGRHAKTEPS